MLWQAVCAVVVLGLLSWFVYVNQGPVPVYGTPARYVDLPVWVVGCIGAVVGILLEFAFTRRLWQTQASAVQTAQAQLRRARAKAKSQEEVIAERQEKIEALEAQLEAAGEPPVTDDEEGEAEVAADDEEDDEVGI
ncbi:MAG: hypothetical protein PVH68_01960 [Armatimonadota bacterium]|jgi:hypothetical protein